MTCQCQSKRMNKMRIGDLGCYANCYGDYLQGLICIGHPIQNEILLQQRPRSKSVTQQFKWRFFIPIRLPISHQAKQTRGLHKNRYSDPMGKRLHKDQLLHKRITSESTQQSFSFLYNHRFSHYSLVPPKHLLAQKKRAWRSSPPSFPSLKRDTWKK